MSAAVSPADLFDSLLAERPPATLLREDGRRVPLALDRWLGPPCAVDGRIADAVTGPVLDIGCGPGRMLDLLAVRGKVALGVDLSPVAVELARSRGREVLLGSVFDHIPGRWTSALLLDGSVGIGGDPAALLARVASLLAGAPDGGAIVELEPPGSGTGAGRVRIEVGDVASEWFPWGHVDTDGIVAVAADSGLTVRAVEPVGTRWFAWLG